MKVLTFGEIMLRLKAPGHKFEKGRSRLSTRRDYL